MIHLYIEITVKEPRSNTFEKLTNFENFQIQVPEFYPHLKIKSKRGNVSVIEQHMVLGKNEFVMMTKHIVNHPKFHEVYVIGGDCKGSHIKEEFVENNGSTKIIVTGKFKTPRKFLIKKAISQKDLEDDIESIIKKLVGS
ncbi:MAG: polyketide cyclase [Nitrosopumilaceae archaeon]|nr:polyketide cyclase [Nitrosopumilaceae archaeon]NIU02496.1 polyketide cyclase [Nitrosopumilaceae archaeon]NIU88957.1 polyketide cyclase [Nitrosopumilaceae archaeon]NIV67068.1 polyketide cyclase [Nitrosopumilaceae archaeon]NIX63097.1 polyketide cyclase [Nitrosopumilaceae archaeon]